jgi:PKD repeat protein
MKFLIKLNFIMKKMYTTFRALCLAAGVTLCGLSSGFAQGFTENFDDITTLAGNGWTTLNLSSPLGSTSWFQGNSSVFASFNGAPTSYIGANFNFVTGANTISGWLITPQRTFRNGDVVTFYTRKNVPDDYADRLEVRLSTAGSSTNVGTSSTSVGDFSNLLLTVNPNLSLGGVYPTSWTLFTITISGLSAPTSGRLAFRYFVTNGGPTGANSDYIGIDNVVYTPYVCPVLSISPNTLPGATAGISYTQTLTQTGALGAAAFGITAGSLPAGMTLTTAGVLSGTPTATGTFNFTVSVTDASGCTGSLNYGITVNCPSNPISFSAFPAVCTSGAPVTLDQASPAGGTYSGVNVNAGAFNPSAGSQSITYNYTDGFGCAFSSSQTFTVTPNPAAPSIIASGPTTICAGSSVNLTVPAPEYSVNVSGPGFMDEVEWTVTDIAGNVVASGGPYSNGLEGGNYTATFSSANGPFTFNINTQGFYGDNNASYTITCVGSGNVIAIGSLLPNQVVGVPNLDCGPIPTYTWSPATGLNTTSGSQVTANPTANTAYTVTATDLNGCSSSATINITVNQPAAAPSVGAPTNICQGAPLGEVTASAGGLTISWYDQVTGGLLLGTGATLNVVGTSVLPNSNTPGTYLVYAEATSIEGCAGPRTLATVNVNPTFSGIEQNNVICQGDSINFGGTFYNGPGSYPFTFQTINGCDSTVTLNLTVNPSYTGGVQNTTICEGESVLFGGNSYTQQGSYPFTFQTISGCDSTVTLNLTVNPSYTGGVQNASICEGESVLFGGVSYDEQGSYPFTFQTINGCDSTVTLNLTVNPSYTGGVQNTTICEGESVLFGGVSYDEQGSYPFTFQTINGCDSTVTLNLTVNPLPVAAFTVSGTSPSFTFTSTSTNASGVSWNFGDGSPADANATATHTYTTNGTFTVTLTATNACGTDTETEDVTVFGIGIAETSGLENMHIFPNPTDGLLNVSFRADSPKEMVLTIVDGLGKTIFVQTLGTVTQKFSQQLDVTHLAPGVYLISLESSDGSKAVKRFVKH